MKLIIGGAFQGKQKFAKERFQKDGRWMDGRTCSLEELLSCEGVFCFHEFVKNWMEQEVSDITSMEERADEFTQQILSQNPNLVIVMNELGYGVVPMEKKDRMWREMTGRIGNCLAANADEVYRVVCGIGQKLK